MSTRNGISGNVCCQRVPFLCLSSRANCYLPIFQRSGHATRPAHTDKFSVFMRLCVFVSLNPKRNADIAPFGGPAIESSILAILSGCLVQNESRASSIMSAQPCG